MKFVVLCSVFLYLKASLVSGIIGGIPATIHQFPYAAAVDVQTSNSKFFCGGTVYTNQFILTAGQCVDGAVLFTVYLGSARLDDPSRLTLATSEYILHPEYDATSLANDIGLIRLRMAIQFTDSIKSINYLAIEPISTHKIRAIGWGQTSDYDSTLANELNYVFVSPLSNSRCQQTYGSQLLDNMVCVEGNYNEGACHGDTGGPLIDIFAQYHMVHVGVSSFVSGNGCESTDPSGYTRTLPYVDWIRNVTSA